MRDQAKPLRTMLYVPANKEDWIRKAPKYGADALILDLEDSVPEPEKITARGIVSRLVPELYGNGVTVFVRVNSVETGLTRDDISSIVQKGLYAITLPMVRGPHDVIEVDRMLTEEESMKGIPEGSVVPQAILMHRAMLF